MEFEGTKGRWISWYNGSYWEVNREEDFQDGKRLAVSVMVFEIEDGDCVFDESSEDEANAHLIAAAPEMLDVLMKIQKSINLMDYAAIEGLYNEVEESINKALNK